ncbi:hypothetical protein, partial [Xiamenia xianingshaonis]|uniref:hypothetical protein n=1 Tax=Xiamenia xianingshaonis TaxID=2682776 RepID=UPI0021BD0DB7
DPSERELKAIWTPDMRLDRAKPFLDPFVQVAFAVSRLRIQSSTSIWQDVGGGQRLARPCGTAGVSLK